MRVLRSHPMRSKKNIQPQHFLFIFPSRASKVKEFKVWDSLTTEEGPNSHQRNTSLETWQGCGGAGSEDKSLLPTPVLKQCVDQTAVWLPPCPYKEKEKHGLKPEFVRIPWCKVLISHTLTKEILRNIIYLHAFEKLQKYFEAFYKLCPQFFGPYWGFTDQDVPERDMIIF